MNIRRNKNRSRHQHRRAVRERQVAKLHAQEISNAIKRAYLLVDASFQLAQTTLGLK
jgi:hypothetical protein